MKSLLNALQDGRLIELTESHKTRRWNISPL